MAGAAGAGDAIQQLFQNRMQQAQLATHQDEFAQQQAQQYALTRIKFQEQADAAKQALEASLQGMADKREIQNRLNFPLLPRTGISPQTVNQMTTGPGALPSDLFPPQGVTPQDAPPAIAAPDQPPMPPSMPGTLANAPAPSLQSFTRLPTPAESTQDRKSQALQQMSGLFPAGSDRAAALGLMQAGITPPAGFFDKQTTHMVPAVVNGKEQYVNEADAGGLQPYNKPTAVPTVVIQTTDANGNSIQKIVPKTAGAEYAGHVNLQMDRQRKLAEFASGDVNAALDQIDAAQSAGLLGPGSGRIYGQFLAGLVGSTGDPAADARLGALKASIKDINTSYPMAIAGNARGGGGAMDRLKSVLDSDKFSADLMKGALHEISGALARRTAAPTATGAPANETPQQRIARLLGGG